MSRVSGMDSVLRQMETWAAKKVANVKTEVITTVYEVGADAKADAAVDTGELRANISEEVKNIGLSGTVSANAPHSAFIEFGTGGSVEVPPGLEAIAAPFQSEGKRQVNLPARPFLFNNAEKGFQRLQQRIKKLF